jgi:hypothetical protein
MARNAVTRRFFIGGSVAFGAFGGNGILKAESPFRPGEKPRLKFGVISDVHVIWGANRETFRHTLEYYRDSGVDAVMICGDIVDLGLVSDLEDVAADWQSVFPGNRAPDGRHVEKIFVTGNHDWIGHKYGTRVKNRYPDPADYAKNILETDLKGNWERIFDEPFAPVYMKEVKGYRFVGAQWIRNDCNGRSEDFNGGIKEFYTEHAKDFDPTLPFFHAQHPHPKDTCYGPNAWGRDNGVTTEMLSAYPNAVAFSGHSHYALTDERTVWQGAFTSIGTSSLRYSSVLNSDPAPGYENYSKYDEGKTMRRLPTADGRQGMLVSVFDDAISISRREFVTDQSLGSDWVIPLPAAESKPFAYAARAKSSIAPEFAPGGVVTVAKGKGRSRGTRKNPPVEKDVYNLSFPAAVSTAKTRAFEYRLTFIGKDGRREERRLVAPGFHMPVGHKRATEDVKCSFIAESLPAAPFTVEVRALSSFNKEGAPIKGTFTGKAG